jgi:hypothetical protein
MLTSKKGATPLVGNVRAVSLKSTFPNDFDTYNLDFAEDITTSIY